MVEKLRTFLSEHQLLAYRLGGVLAVTVLLTVLHGWLKRGLRGLDRRIVAEQGQRIRELRLQSVTLLPAGAVVRFLRALVGGLRMTLMVVLGYLYITFVCVQFPATESVARWLGGLLHRLVLAGWQSFLDYLPNLLTILVTLTVVRYCLIISSTILNAIGDGSVQVPGFDPEWTDTTRYLVRFMLILLGVVVVAPLLPGAASPAFKGLSVFVGILVSVGSGGAMSNIVSGIFLTYSSSFRVGDVVAVGDVKGHLVSKNLLVVRLRTFKNEEVTIPNSEVMSARIMNFSVAAREHRLILYTSVTLGYDAPWREAHRLLLEAAGNTEGVNPDPAPFVLQTSLDGSWITYQLNVYTSQAERLPAVYSNLHAQIQDSFNAAGLELMTTSYLSLRDGNLSTIPGTQEQPIGFRIANPPV